MPKKTHSFLLLLLVVTSQSTVAYAKDDFPGEIERAVPLSYQVPCSVCHIKGNTGSPTPITPFALSMRSRGLSGGPNSIASALAKMKTDNVDSDGDGVSDIAELEAGTDPNSSANSSIVNDPEPGYGCGGTAPRGRGGLGAVTAAALGWLLLRRRRIG